MSDDPVRAPFANPLPPVPETDEEREARLEAEREAQQAAVEEAAANPPAPPGPLTDEHVYPTPATGDPKVTHAAMSTEDLEEIGCDEDGNPVDSEPPPVEPEEPTDE